MRFGSIAQTVEQRTFNPLVEGSIPSGPTINNASVAKLVDAPDLGSGDENHVSSNLTARTENKRGNSSVGRALALQAKCRGFDSRLLHRKHRK